MECCSEEEVDDSRDVSSRREMLATHLLVVASYDDFENLIMRILAYCALVKQK